MQLNSLGTPAGGWQSIHYCMQQKSREAHTNTSEAAGSPRWIGLVMVCSGHTAACATNTRAKGAANDQTDQTPLSRLIYYGRSSSIICGRPSSEPRLFAVRNVTPSAGLAGRSGLVTPSVCTFLSQLAIICNPRLFIWYPHCIVTVHRHHAARDHTFTTRHCEEVIHHQGNLKIQMFTLHFKTNILQRADKPKPRYKSVISLDPAYLVKVITSTTVTS